jgi:hypothetical protein
MAQRKALSWKKREALRECCQAFCTLFAEALIAKEFRAAYAMTATPLRSGMTLRAFEKQHRRAWARFCVPYAILEIDANAVGADEAGSGDLGFPDAVPHEARLARMAVSLLAKGPGCDLWLNLCEEEGKVLVAGFAYEPLDL